MRLGCSLNHMAMISRACETIGGGGKSRRLVSKRSSLFGRGRGSSRLLPELKVLKLETGVDFNTNIQVFGSPARVSEIEIGFL